MNTKIYKKVLSLTNSLMAAAEVNDQSKFDEHYAELKQLCTENENTDKDHPVQWETLADFTEDLVTAVSIYEQALVKADAIDSADFRSSIGLSAATLNIELGNKAAAVEHLEKAKASCVDIVDVQLKTEIHGLLKSLKSK